MEAADSVLAVTGTQVIGAVDVGGTKVAVGVVTSEGKILAKRELITANYASGGAAAEAITSALTMCLDEIGAPVCGIGIGCTGPIDPRTGIIGKVANLPGWEGYGLTEALAGHFCVNTAMENDADAAALAEHRWGSGKGSDRFVYVTLSTGIGAGIILDGNLYRGRNRSHPELGHHTIEAGGPLCYCGANGCWESLASGLALRDWYLQHTTRQITEEAFGAREIFGLFDCGEPLAQEAVARLSRYVGIGLANLTTLLVPDVIALGGGLTARADVFLPAAERLFRSTCGEVPAQDTEICLAHLHENIGLAGAAAAWLTAQQPEDARPSYSSAGSTI